MRQLKFKLVKLSVMTVSVRHRGYKNESFQ